MVYLTNGFPQLLIKEDNRHLQLLKPKRSRSLLKEFYFIQTCQRRVPERITSYNSLIKLNCTFYKFLWIVSISRGADSFGVTTSMYAPFLALFSSLITLSRSSQVVTFLVIQSLQPRTSGNL